MDPSLPQPSSASRDPPATGPQIRSRVTVVCAECKRLKLRCDRNIPCGSCKKRDTVVRCIYSPAAAEKVDLHSLNNRLIQVEAFLSMFTAGQTPPTFHPPYPFSYPSNFIGNSTQTSGPSTQTISSHNHVHRHHHHAVSGIAESGVNDSIMFSAHDVASIWLEGLDLGLSWPPPSSSPSFSSSNSSSDHQPMNTSSAGHIKLEQSPIDPGPSLSNLNDNGSPIVIDVDNALSHTHPNRHPSSRSTLTPRASSPSKRSPLLIDPRSEREIGNSYVRPQEAQYQPSRRRRPSSDPNPLPALSIYYPVLPASPPDMSSGFGPIDTPTSSFSPLNSYNFPTTPLQIQQPSQSKPQVTPALLSLLPPLSTCQHLLARARDVVKVSPVVLGPMFSWGPNEGGCAGWSNFERRCLILLGGGGEWGECNGDREGGSKFEQGRKQRERVLTEKEREKKEMARKAQEIYFAGLQRPPQQGVHPQRHRHPRHQSPGQSHDSVMGDLSVAGDPERVRARGRRNKDGGTVPSLTFFAATCAMLAVGAALESSTSSYSHPDRPDTSHGSPSNSTQPVPSNPSSSTTGASMGTSSASPAFFYALSQQALGVWDTHVSSSMGNGEQEGDREKERADYILACILGVGYLMSQVRLESSTAEGFEGGKEKRAGVIYALVGKMVSVARTMGLGREDHAPATSWTSLDGRTNQRELQKKEWRRMLWWEVMFYDFFTADALGHPQYIPATSYKTKLPACSESTSPSGSTSQHRPQRRAQEDALGIREDDMDDPESSSRSMDTTISHLNDDPPLQQPAESMVDPKYHYLGTRYRIVQLAQTIKTRIAHPDCCCGYTFDQATALESDVRRLESELDTNHRANVDREQDAILQAQNCEHTLMANLLVLKLYSPFLRQAAGGPASGSSSSVSATSSPAAQASVAAAHAILRASKSLHSITKAGGVILPAMLEFYPLDKLVFDAVVVCSHASLTGKVPYSPSFGGDGSTLLEDITSGVHILYDIGSDDPQTRAVIDAIHKRVVSRGADASAGYPANMLKRKHDQVDMGAATASGDGSSSNGASAGSNPAVMASAFDPSNNGTDQRQQGGLSDLAPGAAPTAASSLGNFQRDKPQLTEEQGQKVKSPLASVGKAVKQSKDQAKGKDKKQVKQVGIRVRPGKDNLAAARSRAQTASTQPLLTSTPRPLPKAERVFAFQQQQKQKLQAVSAASASSTSSAAQSPAAAGGGNRSRSSSFTHVQSEPRQHSQQAGSQNMEYTFGVPPIPETMHAVQRRQFGITDLNPQQPQHLSSEPPSSFVPQPFNHGQSHPIYSQPQPTYEEGKTTSPGLATDGMGYSALPSPFSNSNTGPSPPASSSPFSTSVAHPPTPTFGPRHPVPPTFGPQPPVAAPPTAPATYIPQFTGASYATTSTNTSNFIDEMEMDHVSGSSLYEKSHLEQQTTMYEVKPSMENQNHHLFRQEQQHQRTRHQQQPMGSSFYELHPHSLPMGMGTTPTWPPPNEHQEQQSPLSSQPFWGSNSRDLRY